MKLGGCIDLSTLEPNLIISGGATGTWTPISAVKGTFDVTHPAGSGCAEVEAGTPTAFCEIMMRGCGKIKVTIDGRGQRYNAFPLVTAIVDDQPGISFEGANASVLCDTVPLILTGGSNPMEWTVRCGSSLQLLCYQPSNAGAPDLACTFTVEVVP